MVERVFSIIIPTKNSARTLRLVLKSIAAQTYKNHEVVVVDGGSSDATVEVAKAFGARVIPAKSVERSAQRNIGAKASRGEYLYFIDADFWLAPNVLAECSRLLSTDADAVIVPNISNPRRGLTAKIRYYERLSYLGSGIYEAARCMKREVFWRAGGFDESLYAYEDYDLHRRIVQTGAKVAGLNNAFEIHIDEPDFRTFTVKTLYYGRNVTRYFKKTREVMHINPLRPTFLKKEFVAYVASRLPIAPHLVIALKLVQAYVAALGAVLPTAVDPYMPPAPRETPRGGQTRRP